MFYSVSVNFGDGPADYHCDGKVRKASTPKTSNPRGCGCDLLADFEQFVGAFVATICIVSGGWVDFLVQWFPGALV